MFLRSCLHQTFWGFVLDLEDLQAIKYGSLVSIVGIPSSFQMPNPGNFRSAQWRNTDTIQSRSFICGYCGDKISSEKGYLIVDAHSTPRGGIYLCPGCFGPTFFTPFEWNQIPGTSFGNTVAHVPNELNQLYQEARSCTSNANYTASVLVCRKMLMNIAVEQKAAEGLKFIEYVDYLSEKGFVPPNGKQWVDHIRKKGNEANHEIALMKDKDAKELIIFIEMLLKFIYEFPNLIPQQQPG